MKTKYINVGDNDWGILVCYDYNIYDYDDMWAIMRSFGMTDKDVRKSMKVLENINTGMTISNENIRMSAVFISEAESESEWWNTIIHECKHVADTIINYYDVVWDSEEAAYLTGFLTKKMVELIATPCY